MDIVLAMDLMNGLVVHGSRGERSGYRPLTWGLSPSAEPRKYVRLLRPRYLYIADLDRIGGGAGNSDTIMGCVDLVERCYVDMGARRPGERLEHERIVNVFGTETIGCRLHELTDGYISIDMKGGRVIPGGEDPADILKIASELPIEGCIILDISAVGTGAGLSGALLMEWRSAYTKRLLYGGGIGDERDLDLLASAGYDGAILSTAIHRRDVDLECVRSGTWY
ncbi:MAG: HisA/HisF-related TIM barrel protein [Methanomicrobiales archaeon]|nr:HisA/HisF-related TIM barrel protein [Methanomicrobiales archaeon]